MVKVIEVAKKKQRVDDGYAQGMDPFDDDEDYYDEEYDGEYEEEEVLGIGIYEGIPDAMIMMLQEATDAEEDEEVEGDERLLIGLSKFLKQSVTEHRPSRNMQTEWRTFILGLT